MGCWVFSKPHVAAALALAILLCNAPLSSSVPTPPPPPPRDSTGEDGDGFTMTRSDVHTLVLFVYGLVGIFALIPFVLCVYELLKQRTVVTVQVVVSARGGDIGSALHDAAAGAVGWRGTLKGTIKKLVGEQQNFIYGSTSVKVRRGTTYRGLRQHLADLASKEVKKLEIQRVKLQNGLLVPKLVPKQNKDYTLVTIVVALRGAHQLPSVDSSSEEMKDALKHLDTKLNQILVAEVVWGYKDPFAAMGLLESCPNLKSFIS
ncbi:unnamed protein product [Linum trigynum]|uniref:Uncharacterized protein n=1 Tax=Linum trigynum TaxID=586398 RepID=A0AAV2FX80_9ROSI